MLSLSALLDTVIEAITVASPGVATALLAQSDLEARLLALSEAGRVAHPTVVVDAGAWARHLARHLDERDPAEQLGALRAADVHLVLGCCAGDAAALAIFDRRLRGVAAQALAGIRLGSLSVDEVLQDVRVKLLVGEPGQTKLESYSGRGVLDGWLRVSVARTALSRLRTVGTAALAVSSKGDDPFATMSANDDPRLALLRARSAPVMKRAIEEAIAELPFADRTLLRLHVVDGLSMSELAGVYDVHRASVARRVAKAKTSVFESARVRAIAALGIAEAEFDSLVGAVMSQIELTLRGVLEPSAPRS